MNSDNNDDQNNNDDQDGGKRKRNMYGGERNMSPPSINMAAPSVPIAATGTRMAGGRRRRSTRKMRGGQTSTMMKGGQASTMTMKGGAKKPAVGTKAQVWHGTVRHTVGGLTKKDLMKHKGRIISRKKHALGKKALKNLIKAGYKAKKGTFKLFRK